MDMKRCRTVVCTQLSAEEQTNGPVFPLPMASSVLQVTFAHRLFDQGTGLSEASGSKTPASGDPGTMQSRLEPYQELVEEIMENLAKLSHLKRSGSEHLRMSQR